MLQENVTTTILQGNGSTAIDKKISMLL